MNTTPAQKKAHAEFERRLKEAGGSKITLRLDPEPTKRLAELTAEIGSRDKAVAAAIMAYRTAPPVQDTKAGPVADDEGKQAERRSREHTKAAKTTARISVDVPLAGTFTRPIPQKSSPKPKR